VELGVLRDDLGVQDPLEALCRGVHVLEVTVTLAIEHVAEQRGLRGCKKFQGSFPLS
jgi:hypothetical protein